MSVRVKQLDPIKIIEKDLLSRLEKDRWFKQHMLNRYNLKINRDSSANDLKVIVDHALNVILKADPSPKKGFSNWIIESYLDGGINSLEDLGRVKDSLKKFTEYTRNGQLKDHKTDINRYCGLIGCQHTNGNTRNRPYNMLKIGPKCRPTDREGGRLDPICEWSLESVLETLGDEERLDGEFEKDIIFETPTAFVVKLSNDESARYWGKGTRWCTASRSSDMFNEYNSQGPIYVIVDKLDPREKRYQLHFPTKQYMDIRDEPVILKNLIRQYPDLFEKQISEIYGPNWLKYIVSYIVPFGLKNFKFVETTNRYYGDEPSTGYWHKPLHFDYEDKNVVFWKENDTLDNLDAISDIFPNIKDIEYFEEQLFEIDVWFLIDKAKTDELVEIYVANFFESIGAMVYKLDGSQQAMSLDELLRKYPILEFDKYNKKFFISPDDIFEFY